MDSKCKKVSLQDKKGLLGREVSVRNRVLLGYEWVLLDQTLARMKPFEKVFFFAICFLLHFTLLQQRREGIVIELLHTNTDRFSTWSGPFRNLYKTPSQHPDQKHKALQLSELLFGGIKLEAEG